MRVGHFPKGAVIAVQTGIRSLLARGRGVRRDDESKIQR
jgi:hypothetical protein